MSRPELSLFSYEVMGLVGRSGAGPHDLLRMAQRARILAWAGESQYYVEPKRLARLGYLEARSEPGRTRARTVYTLTDKGLEALREWARTPVTLTPLKSEPLLRLLIADLVGEDVTRESLATLRDDLADVLARDRRERGGGRRVPAPAQVPAARQRVPARLRGLARRARGRGLGFGPCQCSTASGSTARSPSSPAPPPGSAPPSPPGSPRPARTSRSAPAAPTASRPRARRSRRSAAAAWP